MTQNDRRIVIAEIVGSHGVRGDMKIKIHAEDENLVEHEDGVFINDDKSDTKRYIIGLLKPYKNDVWLGRMEGITTPEQIKAMGKTQLYILASELPEIEADDDEEESFYYHDLEGLAVFHDKDGEKGKEVGVVTAVRNFGGGDLLDIRARSGDQFYHPFTKEDVPVLDVKNGFLTIVQREVI
jgi:16S rRNA processing protein RimM